jgi:hypothetical protein
LIRSPFPRRRHASADADDSCDNGDQNQSRYDRDCKLIGSSDMKHEHMKPVWNEME